MENRVKIFRDNFFFCVFKYVLHLPKFCRPKFVRMEDSNKIPSSSSQDKSAIKNKKKNLTKINNNINNKMNKNLNNKNKSNINNNKININKNTNKSSIYYSINNNKKRLNKNIYLNKVLNSNREESRRNKKNENNDNNNNNNSNIYTCDRCNKWCGSHEKKTKHMMKNHWQCEICSEQFDQYKKAQQRDHLLFSHPICLFCDHKMIGSIDRSKFQSRYNNATELEEHVKLNHSHEYDNPQRFFGYFQCECGCKWHSAMVWGSFIAYPSHFVCDQINDFDGVLVVSENNNDNDIKDSEKNANNVENAKNNNIIDDNKNNGNYLLKKRVRYQTINHYNVWGEVFVFYAQQCKGCERSVLPRKSKYLMCSKCSQIIFICVCEKEKREEKTPPHRSDLCIRCQKLGFNCVNGKSFL